MDDETKAALERVRDPLSRAEAQGSTFVYGVLKDDLVALLAHFGGEPLRIAEARIAELDDELKGLVQENTRLENSLRNWREGAERVEKERAFWRTRGHELEAKLRETQDELAHEKGGRLERDDVDMVDAVRATPLGSTPLADRIAELEAELSKSEWRVAELEDDVADARILLEPHFGQETYQLPLAKTTAGLIGRTEKAEARVEELEAQKVDLKTMIQDLRARAEKAERLADQLCAVLGREVGNRGDSEGAVDVAERLIRERDEAVAALRVAKRWAESGDDSIADAGEYVRGMAVVEAILAKYPEAKR